MKIRDQKKIKNIFRGGTIFMEAIFFGSNFPGGNFPMGNFLMGGIFPKGSFPRTVENNLVKLFYLFNYDSSKFSFFVQNVAFTWLLSKNNYLYLQLQILYVLLFAQLVFFIQYDTYFLIKTYLLLSIMGIYLFNLFKVFVYLLYLYTLFKCTLSTMIPTMKKYFDISLDVAHT